MMYVHFWTVYVQKRENPIVNRLNKTKVERVVDHEQERQDRLKAEGAARKAALTAQVRLLNSDLLIVSDLWFDRKN